MINYRNNINNNIRTAQINNVRTKKIAVSKSLVSALSIALPMVFVMVFVIFLNHNSYSKLDKISKANYAIEQEIVRYNNINSKLEEEKQKLLDIKELKRKAIESGFEFNKNVNYI